MRSRPGLPRSFHLACLGVVASLGMAVCWTSKAAPDPASAPDAAAAPGWLNVRDFGAVGDGKADDTQALLGAILAAGKSDPRRPGRTAPTEVLIPVGTYRLTKTIRLDPSFRLVHLRGEGMILPKGTWDAHSTILWDGPKAAPMLDIQGYAGLRISDLKLDGGSKAGVLLRINSIPGVGTALFYTQRVFLDHADTAIELGADMDTRARKLVVLVGTLKALAIAVRNMDARRRVTLLRQRLQALDGNPGSAG